MKLYISWRIEMDGLRELRRRRFLTQKELAAAIGVQYQTVQTWEKGDNTPRLAAMKKLCEVLQVTPDELIAALEASQASEGKELVAA
jgi:transcriptional regulator with XRE-family HTH domain